MTFRLASVLLNIPIALAACSSNDPPIERTEPIVVVDRIASLYSIAADESAVYWSDLGGGDFGGTLYALEDGETEPREIRGITGDIPFADLRASANHLVYVTTDVTDDFVAVSPKTSGDAPRVMFEAGQPVAGPAAHGDQAAWLAVYSPDDVAVSRGVFRADLVTGDVTRVINDRPGADDVAGVAMDDTHIYWTERDGIVRSDGSSVEAFASTRGPIAIDDTDVYWRADGTLYRLARSAPGDQPTVVASEIGTGALELDDENLYFTRDRAIFAVAKQGGEPVEIGRLESADATPMIAVAPAGVYYGDRPAGKLMLIPRADR